MRYLFLLLLLSISFSAATQSYNVMTYNIRLATPQDGINEWSNRKEKVIDLIKKYNPDVLGVQEALYVQMEDLMKGLSDYTYVGAGRDDGKNKGEFSAILFKRDKFSITEQNTFWLSETPTVPGSKSWDAAITRVASWCILKDNITGEAFQVINTHFDHVGITARKESAILLKTWIDQSKQNLPVIVMGDFNCEREDAPYHVMISAKGKQLYDPAPANPPGTFCSFEVNSIPCVAIDYIFHSDAWQVKNYQVITDNDGKYYPSDHLPVMVEVTR